MSTEHTPGPWTDDTQYTGPRLVPFQPGKLVQTIMGNDEDVAYMANWHNDNDERLANARLIAAAPDLLEACEAVLANELDAKSAAEFGGYTLDDKIGDILRAAIAKARP